MPSDTARNVGARSLRASSIIALVFSCSALFAACGGEPIGGEALEDTVGENAESIINGSPDTSHHAVVAMVSSNSVCTGTIIDVDVAQGIGHVLTAAHCGTPIEVRQGNNYLNPSAVYSVVAAQNHPSYDAQALLFDFKMVRIVGVGAQTPVIPVLTPAEDNLSAGTGVLHVGYGKSGPVPGGDNTIRRRINGTLANVSSLQIAYNQPSGGPCSGDSGGPQLTTSGAERVAGVISYGDQNCEFQGVSGRPSAVYDSFILPFINDAPGGDLTCDQCTQAATSGQGACVPQVEACFANNDCAALVDCFNGCGGNNACLQGCATSHPSGYNMYLNIFSCVCDTGCVDECANEQICGGGSGSSTSSGATVTATVSATTTVATGGATTGGGVGGAGGASTEGGDRWLAGNTEDRNYRGSSFGSCSTAVPNRTADGWLALLGLAGLGLFRRRRDERA